MNKQEHYDTLVFIGRFQPPHKAHFKIIEEALKRADRLFILIGSSNSGRTLRNPFTFSERSEMLIAENFVRDAWYDGKIEFIPIHDHIYTDGEWVAQVQNAVTARLGDTDHKVGLVGCAKDNSSYYLKLFPQWGNVDIPIQKTDEILWNSTHIRQNLFNPTSPGVITYTIVPDSVLDVMNRIVSPKGHDADWYLRLCDEYRWVQKYKDQWSTAPYPVIFNTVDAVVVQSGHVLLVKRGAMPGKGLWALPGGYINQDETLEQSMLRELKEETKIQVDGWTLRECTKASMTFADPNRSPRGRVITHAFLIRLPDKTRLPKVKGSDDAEKAKWVPLSELRADNMFEDHYWIIKKLVAGL